MKRNLSYFGLILSSLLLCLCWRFASGFGWYTPATPSEAEIEESCRKTSIKPYENGLLYLDQTVDYYQLYNPTLPSDSNFTEECPDNVTLAERVNQFNAENSTALWIYGGNGEPFCFNVLFYNDYDPVICAYVTMNGNITILGAPLTHVVIALIITSFSVIASLVLLVTYTLFSSLRTLPSKVIMNLAVAFLAGDIIVISMAVLGFHNIGTSTVEKVMFVSFYLFHARFAWMALAGFEMSRNIYKGTQLRFDSIRKRNKILAGYMLFGWGVSVVPTAIMAVVHYRQYEKYESHETPLFGLRGYVVVLVPIGLVLLFNIIVVVFLSIILRKASLWQSRVGHPRLSRRKTNFTRVFVIVLSVLGFSWITIFLVYIPDHKASEALNILYIILNASQPIFVSVAFVGTKKIYRKYHNLCGCKSHRALTSHQKSRLFRGRRLLSLLFTDKDMEALQLNSASPLPRNNSAVTVTSTLFTSRYTSTPLQTSESSSSSQSQANGEEVGMNQQTLSEITNDFIKETAV